MAAVIPAVRVELFTGDFSADFLTLDDPVKGELDEALYPLYDGSDPDVSVDLAADGYAYSVSRGRSSELDDVSVGTLAVSLRNYGGQFVPNSLVDASAGSWDIYGTDVVTLGKRVRLHLDEIVVFDGRVDDIELSYNVSGEALAQINAVDALGILAESQLDAWSTSAQTASERIAAVLDRPEVDFAANRDIKGDGGDITDDTVAAGTNALTYVRHVTYSDLGYVYASRTGLLTFESRQAITTTVQAVFADDGTAIPFSGIEPSSSSRYLYNTVSVTRRGGTEQTAADAASQAAYGVRPLVLTDMLMNTDADALYLAQSLLTLYKSPATRIESLEVNLGSLTSAQRATVLALDLGDFVSITWTPRGTAAVTLAMRVEGIAPSGTDSSLGMVRLSLSPAAYFPDPFILDDASEGVLDTSRFFY